MNKQQASEQLKQLESEVAKLKAIIEAPEPNIEAPEQKAAIAVSKLNGGDGYFGCTAYDEVSRFVWDGCDLDKRMLSQGKVHLTRESAELEYKYNKLNQELRVAMAADWGDVEVDWEDNQDKWCIEWCRRKASHCRSLTCFQKIHFRTKKARDKFYEEHTKEELELLIKGL